MLAISKDRGADRIKAMQAAERERVQKLLERDRPQPTKRKGKKQTVDGIKPTPEWAARYGETQVTARTESGVFLGRVFHRQPWFESLVKRDASDALREKRAPSFTVEDLHALRRYRAAYEAAQRSETRSCLNMERGGGESLGCSPAVLRLRQTVIAMEQAVGALVDTMRAIAIEDATFAQVAMAQFGSREVSYYDDATGRFVSRPAPRSGNHSMRIREEFVAGTKRLTAWAWGPRHAIAAGTPPAERGTPIADAIRAAIARWNALGRPVEAISAAEWTAEALAREIGAAGALDGVMVTIRADWQFGWVLVGRTPEPAPITGFISTMR